MNRFRISIAAICLFLPAAILGVFAASVSFSSEAVAQVLVLPGKFDVTQEGAATLSIPISVPPGTGGMVPALTLDYASGGGNGLLGVGWGVDGLPSITRCPQTLAQDNVHGKITYDMGIAAGAIDNDRFCLNGQRLVSIAGNYGADGTEYRTEIESFSRIISHGYVGSSPQYFDVYTKSGQIIELGYTSDSRVMFANTSGFPSARAWLADNISDTSGNYMTVKYTVNPDTNVANYSEVVPAEIDYTGNSNTGLVPYNKLTFVYANGTRPDIRPLYADGNLVETTQLLTNIKTWSGTPVAPGSTEVNDYQLAYTTSPGTGRELLASVTMCDGTDSTCLPARSFTYQSNTAAAFTFHQQLSGLGSYPNPPSTSWSEIEGDFNGDGKVDFGFISNNQLQVNLSNGDGSFTLHSTTLPLSFGAPPESSNPFANGVGSPPTSPYVLIQGDFNADGKSDFALVEPGAVYFPPPKVGPGGIITFPPVYEPGTIYTYLSNGDGTFAQTGQSIPYVASSTYGLIVVGGDFTGNGRTDFAMVAGSMIYIYLSNGDGTFTASTQSIGQGFSSQPGVNWTQVSGDFNGDGLADFSLISGSASGNTSQIYTYLSNGNGTFSVVPQFANGNLGTPPSKNWIPVAGDFNGDGLTDIAFLGATTTYVLLSQGNGYFTQTGETTGQNFETPPQATWTPIEGDFTGAGLTDVALINGSTMWTFISSGNGQFQLSSQTLNYNYGTPPAKNWTPVVGDFNGDGLTDFGFVTGSTLYTEFSNGPDPDLLSSSANGVGDSTTVTYASPAQGIDALGTIYYGWNTSLCEFFPTSYPSIDIAPSTPVVVITDSSNGIGGTYRSLFNYSCDRADVTGRGNLGFLEQSVLDAQTGITQDTYINQYYPNTGIIDVQDKTYGSVTLSRTANTISDLTPTSSPALPWPNGYVTEVAPQFPYISQSVTTNNDLNGAALPTVTTTNTYDGFGDALTVAISKMLGTTQGSTQTTTNTYYPANTSSPHWILGRLQQSQVVSTTP